jgi:23S rRNA (pseudouridine1915-N3)-methyltransferase
MQIHIIAIGERMPAWVAEAYTEYARRLPHECRLGLREIAAGKRGKGADLARLAREEGERQLAAIPSGCRIIALDRTGRELDTVELASRIEQQMQDGRDLALLIGGPEGLAPGCLAAAHERWSLSRLTFAHPVVRVVVAEQLYRAWSIIRNLPYHR